jgi:hypothetical protein
MSGSCGAAGTTPDVHLWPGPHNPVLRSTTVSQDAAQPGKTVAETSPAHCSSVTPAVLCYQPWHLVLSPLCQPSVADSKETMSHCQQLATQRYSHTAAQATVSHKVTQPLQPHTQAEVQARTSLYQASTASGPVRKPMARFSPGPEWAHWQWSAHCWARWASAASHVSAGTPCRSL